MRSPNYLFSPPYSDYGDAEGVAFYHDHLGFGEVARRDDQDGYPAIVVFEDGRSFGMDKKTVEGMTSIEDSKNATRLIMSAVYARRLFDEMDQN